MAEGSVQVSTALWVLRTPLAQCAGGLRPPFRSALGACRPLPEQRARPDLGEVRLCARLTPMSCSDCTGCPGYEKTQAVFPAVLADEACPECGHMLSAHEMGQARIIARSLSPDAKISLSPPPKGSKLAELRERMRGTGL